MAFGKRKRVYAPNRSGFKKRRTKGSRYRKKSMGAGVKTYTSLNTKGTSMPYRARKTSRRTYLKHLWDSTLFKSHYRSISSTSDLIATPATDTTATLTVLRLLQFGVLNPPWTLTGGLQRLDVGVVPPVFSGDIIMRGGTFAVTFSNVTGQDMRLRVWCIKTNDNPDFIGLPPVVSLQWDPTVEPDFNPRIGNTYGMREVVIEGGNSFTYTGRIKLQKIDQQTFSLEGRSLFMMFTAANVGSLGAGQLRVQRSYNVSLSGDG